MIHIVPLLPTITYVVILIRFLKLHIQIIHYNIDGKTPHKNVFCNIVRTKTLLHTNIFLRHNTQYKHNPFVQNTSSECILKLMSIRIQYTEECVSVHNVNSIEVKIYHTVTHSFLCKYWHWSKNLLIILLCVVLLAYEFRRNHDIVVHILLYLNKVKFHSRKRSLCCSCFFVFWILFYLIYYFTWKYQLKVLKFG